MKLRMLKNDDIPFMLEWMHDDNVVQNLGADFKSKTETDCKRFIENSLSSKENLHMAIVDDEDRYMGTVSLKAIDKDLATAEFAIAVRRQAMGKGYSSYAMKEIIRIGFDDFGLNKIYWCVSKHNKRAIRFYDKNGFFRTTIVDPEIYNRYTPEQNECFYWYCIESSLFKNNR